MTVQKLLHVNSSGRFNGSVTRNVSNMLVTRLKKESPYLKFALGFVGITDVTIIDAGDVSEENISGILDA